MEGFFAALKQVVSERYPGNSYCIGGYQEAAVCIQPDGDAWLVYSGERGNHYSEKRCEDAVQAGASMFALLTHDTRELRSMESELKQLLRLQ